MRNAILFSACLLLSAVQNFAQNVGINPIGAAPDASAMLDVSATDRGLLIPRVFLAATNSSFPVTSPVVSLLVYNQSTVGGSFGVSPGFYSWNGIGWVRFTLDGEAWKPGGNSLFTTGSLGTISNNHVDLITNNIVRGRLTNLGEFVIGATNTTVVGDLMAAVSNATFPFATNGYSAFNGSGVYGAVTNGSITQFAAVQGEYQSNSGGIFNTAGVRGSNQSTTAGTGFRTAATTGPRVGVIGNTTVSNGQYTFGLHGAMGSTDIRCGGVFGDDFGLALGALAYFATNLNDYSVYGFGGAYQIGVSGGRQAGRSGPAEINTQIGLGIYGGVMGGWVRGLVYGEHVKGERYSLYVDGKTYTNTPVTELIAAENGNRLPAYSLSSLQTDLYARGKATLQNGEAYISFDKNFAALVSGNPDDMIITVSPTGSSKGIYIAKQDPNGFVVKENEGGSGVVSFNWIAIAARRDQSVTQHSPELLNADFDKKMDGVMYNDNNLNGKPQYIWWDGQDIRFDQPPPRKADPNYRTNTRILPSSNR